MGNYHILYFAFTFLAKLSTNDGEQVSNKRNKLYLLNKNPNMKNLQKYWQRTPIQQQLIFPENKSVVVDFAAVCDHNFFLLCF